MTDDPSIPPPVTNAPPETQGSLSGFRRAILRGLGVVLPPLLTIVLLIWAWNSIEVYVLRPIESGVRNIVVWSVEETFSEIPKDAIASQGNLRREGFTFEGTRFVPDSTGRRWFPEYVQLEVDDNMGSLGPSVPKPASAKAYWYRYVQLKYMPRSLVVPIFLLVFTTALYFLGRLFTFGIGRWLLRVFDNTILTIPLINKVYGGVKQVTDFAFNEREIEFNNVVAIEYPRKGIWSLGFVTGNSLRQISEAMGEEMLSVLMPTSPMPMTGFTVTVKRSETIDMDLTIDEAIQFIVSCGVVVPEAQKVDLFVANGKEAIENQNASLTHS